MSDEEKAYNAMDADESSQSMKDDSIIKAKNPNDMDIDSSVTPSFKKALSRAPIQTFTHPRPL